MASFPANRLVVTLPPEVGAKVNKVAREQHRTADEIVCEACQRHLAALETANLDEQYQRGYERIPEDIADLEALLPHLPVPREDW